MLGKSTIKWRQRPDMTMAVDWDVKHQTNKQTNKIDLHFSDLQQVTAQVLEYIVADYTVVCCYFNSYD